MVLPHHLAPALTALAARHDVIGDVRGSGVFWALELVADRATKEPLDAATMGRVKAGLMTRGLLPFTAENRIHVVPPAVVTPDEIARGVAIIDDTLASITRER